MWWLFQRKKFQSEMEFFQNIKKQRFTWRSIFGGNENAARLLHNQGQKKLQSGVRRWCGLWTAMHLVYSRNTLQLSCCGNLHSATSRSELSLCRYRQPRALSNRSCGSFKMVPRPVLLESSCDAMSVILQSLMQKRFIPWKLKSIAIRS